MYFRLGTFLASTSLHRCTSRFWVSLHVPMHVSGRTFALWKVEGRLGKFKIQDSRLEKRERRAGRWKPVCLLVLYCTLLYRYSAPNGARTPSGVSRVRGHGTWRRTANSEQRTANGEQRSANCEQVRPWRDPRLARLLFQLDPGWGSRNADTETHKAKSNEATKQRSKKEKEKLIKKKKGRMQSSQRRNAVRGPQNAQRTTSNAQRRT